MAECARPELGAVLEPAGDLVGGQPVACRFDDVVRARASHCRERPEGALDVIVAVGRAQAVSPQTPTPWAVVASSPERDVRGPEGDATVLRRGDDEDLVVGAGADSGLIGNDVQRDAAGIAESSPVARADAYVGHHRAKRHVEGPLCGRREVGVLVTVLGPSRVVPVALEDITTSRSPSNRRAVPRRHARRRPGRRMASQRRR